MEKIISKILEVEVVYEHTQETESVLCIDTRNVEANSKTIGLTTMGYDDEIGLWEELEHRNNIVDASSI